MGVSTSASTGTGLHGRLKLAKLLEMSEDEFERGVREAEANPLFARLRESGVVVVESYDKARFAARRLAGYGLRAQTEGLGDVLDGQGEIVELIKTIGQESFEKHFLQDEKASDAARAKACGVSPEQARRLREFVDRLYIKEEFDAPAPRTPAPPTFSPVAGVELDDGRPVIGFFNREIWKGSYRVDDEARIRLKQTLPPEQYRKLERFLGRLEFLERRKSTLYRVLEAVVEAQKDYLLSGEPSRRRPLTQRALAADLDVLPSTLNRLIGNKSVQLPWGLEAPLAAFVPSAKTVWRDHLHDLARERPELSDDGLSAEMKRLFGVALSRRSIAQYRKDLGLPGRAARARLSGRRDGEAGR